MGRRDKMKTVTVCCWLFAVCSIVTGCGPPGSNLNIYQEAKRYQQNTNVREALFIRERNGTPFILASAFLIDKQKGRFASAKHFVGSESDGQCKIFFNGHVYDGFLLNLPPITDLAIVQILGSFDTKSFPEPYKIAEYVNVGDKIFVRGIHPHPLTLQKNKIILPIFRDYYGLVRNGNEFVFDDLGGKITKLNVPIQNKRIRGSPETLAEVTNLYTELKTTEEHRLSIDRGFGGLSGGPTVNERNELVGVNSNETPGGLELRDGTITNRPWNTLFLVPAKELEKLLPLIANIK